MLIVLKQIPKISFLLAALILFSGVSLAATIDAHLVTGDPRQGSGCMTPTAKTSFSPDDDYVFSWVLLSNAFPFDRIGWQWHAPDNTLYEPLTERLVGSAGSVCWWLGLPIKGQRAANLIGNWKVNILINNILAASDNFSIESAQQPPSSTVRTDSGAVALIFNSETYVPGSLLDIQLETKKGTLKGNADLYLAVVMPNGPLMFFSSTGGVAPFLRNVAVVDETKTLLTTPFPVDLPFGMYYFYAFLVYADADVYDLRNWASSVSLTTFSYEPLSPGQKALIQSRGGNPDLIAVTWIQENFQKRESWVYVSGTPTRYSFLNGNLEGQEAASGSGMTVGPKVDPALFTPQTTPDQLKASFGPPVSGEPISEAPEFLVLRYTNGIDAIFQNGRFTAASTSQP